MISHRYAPVTIALLALALVPTVIHSYRGVTIDDGFRVSAIPETLAGASSRPTDRQAGWGEKHLAATDWIERDYTLGTDVVRLFAARSFDPKRLYHHPELAVLRGYETVPAGRAVLPGRDDVPIHLLRLRRGRSSGVGAYALYYDGQYVRNPLWFQVRTAGELLVNGRRPMALILTADLDGSLEKLDAAPAVRLLAAAVKAFEAAEHRGE